MTAIDRGSSCQGRGSRPVWLLLLVIAVAHANGLGASWHYDDVPNILNNADLHLPSLGLDGLLRAYFNPNGPNPSRHYPNLTFALNWFVGQDRAWGYHAVNVVLHGLTALCLFRVFVLLFQTSPVLAPLRACASDIGLLAAALWALHPIQTSAVTYIVQRSTVMAALGGAGSILCFLKARTATAGRERALFALWSALAVLIALGCKENIVLLPVSILCMDIMFFPWPLLRDKRKLGIVLGVLGCLAVPAMVWAVSSGTAEGFLSGYGRRPYTLGQRLLTESRVFWFYLSQIVWPVPGRFSILHGIEVSTRLFAPWTTALAVAGLAGVGFGAAWFRSRWPLAAFAVVFFLLNHMAESSILPLQLVFEHRNYLPSFFMFLPLAAWIVPKAEAGKRAAFSRLAAAGMAGGLVFLGAATHARNADWASEESLWRDALAKAPEDARPYQVLAAAAMKRGDEAEALRLYEQALVRTTETPVQDRAMALSNLGNLFHARREMKKAIGYYREAMAVKPDHEQARYNRALALLDQEKWDEAQGMAEDLLRLVPGHVAALNLRGLALLKSGREHEALAHFERVRFLAPGYGDGLLNLAMAFSRLGRFSEADGLMGQLWKASRRDAGMVLCRLEHASRKNVETEIQAALDEAFNTIPLALLRDRAAGQSDPRSPVDAARVAPLLADRLAAFGRSLARTQ